MKFDGPDEAVMRVLVRRFMMSGEFVNFRAPAWSWTNQAS